MTRSGDKGLTLVELVITISLAAIISIPMGILLAEHLTGALRARDYTVAMNLARHELERLDVLNPASANNFCHPELNLTAGTPAPSPDPAYAITRIVSCQLGDCSSQSSGVCHSPANARNGVKRIEIRVTKGGSSELQASVVTYRTKYVLFGS